MLAFHVTEILHPDQLINQLGTAATIVIFLLVFAENGLLLGFFLPGDSLLVLAGLYSTSKAGGTHGQHTHLNIGVVIPVIIIASIIGSEVGYQIGKVVGPRLFNKPDSRLFKHEYVERTRTFLERYGESKAVFLSRFMPIIRPFVNSAVGVVEMPRRTFTMINIAASIGWGQGCHSSASPSASRCRTSAPTSPTSLSRSSLAPERRWSTSCARLAKARLRSSRS